VPHHKGIRKQSFFLLQRKSKEDARKTQQVIGWPSTPHVKEIVANNLLRNFSFTVDDINRSEIVFGKATPLLKGKMTRRSPEEVKLENVLFPLPVLYVHKKLQLYVDFFNVNNIPFVHTKSGKVNFLIAHACKPRSKRERINHLSNVANTYEARGFKITDVFGDNEFSFPLLQSSMQPVNVHIAAPHEHVSIAERSIRTTKERARCMTHTVSPLPSLHETCDSFACGERPKMVKGFPIQERSVKNYEPCNYCH